MTFIERALTGGDRTALRMMFSCRAARTTSLSCGLEDEVLYFLLVDRFSTAGRRTASYWTARS